MALPYPKLLQTTLAILALFLNMLANNYVHSQSETSFTYPHFSKNSKNLTLQGDAYFPLPALQFLSLTKLNDFGVPQINSVGRVVYSPPVQFWEPGRQSSFQTTIVFSIGSLNPLPCCGMAFFIAPVGTTIPPASVGQGLGIFSSIWPPGTDYSLFAVVFDISLRRRHIGIDINSRRSVNETMLSEDWLGKKVTLQVNYEATTRKIIVGANIGPKVYEVSYVHDLKTVLPQQVQVGISAATGYAVEFYYAFAWDFTSSLVSDEKKIDDEHNEENQIRQYV